MAIALLGVCAPNCVSPDPTAQPPSPSPSPPMSRLRTSLYTRAFYASQLTSSNLPGGNTQNDTIAANAFSILHAEYLVDPRGLTIGGSYYYSSPNPFAPQSYLSSILEAYLSYDRRHVSAKIGDQLFSSPWADSHNTFGLPPSAFQGADVVYANGPMTFEAADMTRFQNSTATSFSRTTLLTSFPIGSPGMPSNMYAAGAGAVDTNGFVYGRASYQSAGSGLSVDGYAYGVNDLVTMLWLDAKLSATKGLAPFAAVQAGTEKNAGASYIGKVRSSIVGIQAGLNPSKNLSLSAAVDYIPWRHDNIRLSNAVSCDSSGVEPTYQISITYGSLAYLLPQQAAQCVNNPDRSTTIYYGGWASPYSDSYSFDPVFTTSPAVSTVDRRSPGVSSFETLTYTPSPRLSIGAGYSWYDFSNTAAHEQTNFRIAFATYHLGKINQDSLKGAFVRCYYLEQRESNVAYADGSTFLGGTPFLRYSRIQFEYTL